MANNTIGQHSVTLLRHLSQNKNDPIPPYQRDLVSSVLAEVQQLHEEIVRDLSAVTNEEERKALEAILRVRNAAMNWNKRCLLAYHHFRLMKLKEIRWQLGSVLPAEIRNNLAPHEIRWFIYYCDNLADYMSRLNDRKGLDLTLYKQAPKCLYVQVRCVSNYGDFELEDGTVVVLSRGSMHFLPLNQCEKLIRQGILEQIL